MCYAPVVDHGIEGFAFGRGPKMGEFVEEETFGWVTAGKGLLQMGKEATPPRRMNAADTRSEAVEGQAGEKGIGDVARIGFGPVGAGGSGAGLVDAGFVPAAEGEKFGLKPLHLDVERMRVGREWVSGRGRFSAKAKPTLLSEAHRVVNLAVTLTAGGIVGGFGDLFAAERQRRGVTGEVVELEMGADLRDEGRGEVGVGGETARRSGLVVGFDHAPVGEDLGPGGKACGERMFQLPVFYHG